MGPCCEPEVFLLKLSPCQVSHRRDAFDLQLHGFGTFSGLFCVHSVWGPDASICWVCSLYLPQSVQWRSYFPCKICRKLCDLFLSNPVMTVYIHRSYTCMMIVRCRTNYFEHRLVLIKNSFSHSFTNEKVQWWFSNINKIENASPNYFKFQIFF